MKNSAFFRVFQCPLKKDWKYEKSPLKEGIFCHSHQDQNALTGAIFCHSFITIVKPYPPTKHTHKIPPLKCW